MLYSVVLVSAIQQSESVIQLCSFPIYIITEYWVEFPVLYSRPLLVTYFTYSSVSVSIPISQFIPSPFSPVNHNFVFFICESFSSVNKFTCTFFFQIPHVSDIIWYLSFSVWLHSILSPSMLLQMVLFHSFLQWLVFQYVYVPHLVYPFLCRWTFRLLPCSGCCKQCCSGLHVSF